MAQFDYGFAQILYINGVPDNDYGRGLAASALEKTGLTTDVLLFMGQNFQEAPASVFKDHKVHAGVQIKDLETFFTALAAVNGNDVQLKCERIFDVHTLQHIYSSVLVQAFADSFLDEAMDLGIETELESLISGILNNATITGE